MGAAEDRELLDAARRGDRDAFVRLTRILWDGLFADAYHVVRNLEGAEDAFLDGMAAGWHGLRSVADPGDLEAWLGERVARFARVEAGRHSHLVVPGPELAIDIAPHLPDRLHDQLIERLRREGQVPAWRLRLNAALGSLTGRVVAIVVAVVLVLGVGALAAGAMGKGPPPPPPTANEPIVTPIIGAGAGGECLAGNCIGVLDPGTHHVPDALIDFSFNVPAGWENTVNTLGETRLERVADTTGAAIHVWGHPVAADQTACQAVADPVAGDKRSAYEMTAFLTSHPGLQTTDPVEVTISEQTGFTFEAAWAAAVPPCSPQVSLFVHDTVVTDDLWWKLEEGQRMAVWFLDAPGAHTVLIDVQAPADAFEAFLAEAKPIVESFDFIP